jgi:predicted nuclease of predicted toxin-antitoxin system
MSELFARIYLDEDVSVLLAALLRSRGFEAQTTVEAGNAAATDERQLEYAANREFVLLTHNRVDFEKLAARYLQESKPHAGIIIAVRRLPHDLLRRLLTLLNRNAADEFANNVWYV